MRSYMIQVTLRTGSNRSASAVSMLTQVTGQDLETLLAVLNSNPAVTTIAVHKTLSVPNLPTIGRLTSVDLGMEHLEKVQ